MSTTEFVINPMSIGSFNIGKVSYDIKAAINNSQFLPSLWQFRYQPLFIPLFSNDQLEMSPIFDFGGKFRFEFYIILDNEAANLTAYKTLQTSFPKEFPTISKLSIKALQVSKISIELPELKKISSSATMARKDSFSQLNPSRQITITIEDDTRENLQLVKDQLPRSFMTCDIELEAKSATKNKIDISFKKLMSTNLFAKLNGLPGVENGEVFIQRDDFRKLSENIHEQIDIRYTIANPDQFNSDLINDMLKTWSQSEDIQTFDSNKLQQTYNSADLEPDTVSKTLEKMFDWNESEKHYIHKTDIDLSSKANVFQIIDAEVKGKLNLSSDELDKMLKKHDIEAQFEGKKIVVKSIRVIRINLSDFFKETNIFSESVFIKDDGLQTFTNTLKFSDFTNSFSSFKMIPNPAFPIGAFFPFGGLIAPEDPDWMLCDGSSLLRTSYPDLFLAIGINWGFADEYTFNLPELRGYFLRGAYPDKGLGDRFSLLPGGNSAGVGSYQHSATKLPSNPWVVDESGEHKHSYKEMVYNDDIDGVDSAVKRSFEHTNQDRETTTSGKHTHSISGGDAETRPENAAVNYIIKVSNSF